jgi:PKD repeat protein
LSEGRSQQHQGVLHKKLHEKAGKPLMPGNYCNHPQGKIVYPKPSIIIILFAILAVFLLPSRPETASAASATVTWSRNQEPDIAGYTIHYGKIPGEYPENLKIYDDKTEPAERSYTIDTLDDDTVYYFVLTAFDKSGQESDPSERKSLRTASANQAPVARAAANTTYGTAPLCVNFDGASSYDPDGGIVSYRWSFGDGEYAESPCPSHVFTQPGSYTCWLTVTDEFGATGTTAVDVVVIDEVPIGVNFQSATATTPEGFFADTGQSFAPARGYGWVESGILIPCNHNSALSPDQAHDTVIYTERSRVWEMLVPTGTYEVTLCIGSPLYNLPGQSVQIEGEQVIDARNLTFAQWLEETATVTVTDGRLTVTFDRATYWIGLNFLLIRPADTGESTLVENQAPVAEFQADPLNGLVPLVVTFDASASSDPEGTIVSYDWDFGDGEQASGMMADHTYNSPGSFVVTLTVTDEHGAQASKSESVEVWEPEAGFELAINFQPAGAATPEGFLADAAQNFDEARGYGWTASGVLLPYDHNSYLSPDQLHDTVVYAHQGRVWEAVVPTGTYEVTLCIGSPRYNLYAQSIQVEGDRIIEAQTLPAGHWIEETASVEVMDGKLTITFSGATYYIGMNYVLITLDAT